MGTGGNRPGQLLENPMKHPTPTLQAPDAQTDAASGDTEVVKRKVAKHELLDASGAVVEDEKLATGIRYTLLANSQTFDFQTGLDAGNANTMLAVFGAKTLATNETSAARNNTKGEASPDEQIAAVHERFALIQTGEWVDRTREGVGAKVDPDALCEAIGQVLISEAKIDDATWVASKKAEVRQRIEDDKLYARKARSIPAVASAYAALVGRTTATTDALL